jgi:hypothetical protein
MRRTMTRAAAWLCACAALCAGEPAKTAPKARWFGASREDFARAKEFAGLPLKIKARFVRALESPKRGGKTPGRTVMFLVEAEGGRIACSMRRDAKDAELLRDMKHATPLVVHGAVDAKKRVFLVRGIAQGWGKTQLEAEE